MQGSDRSSPQSRLREMLNEEIAPEPIECILQKIQLQLITGLEQLAPPAYDFSELDKIFGKFERNKVSTKSQYARLILDIVTYFIKTIKNVSISRQDYMRLQQETQDNEKKIREHIKIENKLRLEFDIRDRTILKLKEQNMKLRDDNIIFKQTNSELKKRLQLQLKIFISKLGDVATNNLMQSAEKYHKAKQSPFKDPDESNHLPVIIKTNKIHSPYEYHENFNKLLKDIRKSEGKERYHSLE